MKGAADAAVAHTTARKTERKNVPENFMAECRYGLGGCEERRMLESGWSPGLSRTFSGGFCTSPETLQAGGAGDGSSVVDKGSDGDCMARMAIAARMGTRRVVL